MATPRIGDDGVLTTKGDLPVFDGSNLERRGVGANGTILIADASQATGLRYAYLETGEWVPQPELADNTQATRALQTTYDGASMKLDRALLMSRLIYRLTALSLGGTQRFILYQAPDGASGTATKIASFTGAPGGLAATNVTGVFEQGSVFFSPGLFYVLFGRPSGLTATIQTYTNAAINLLDQNVDNLTHVGTFTTTISAAGADPATFNPLPVAGGGNATPSTADICPVVRFRA